MQVIQILNEKKIEYLILKNDFIFYVEYLIMIT